MVRILVVDDEPMVRDFIEAVLVSAGYQVETCSNGVDALAQMTNRCFELVITDYLMPEMTGDQLAVSIREQVPDLPVILMTGNVGEFGDPAASPSSFSCVLEKPVSVENLRLAVARLTR